MAKPLVAVLKSKDLELVAEIPLALESFPDMIETGGPENSYQYFRIGIADRKAYYREGVSLRI